MAPLVVQIKRSLDFVITGDGSSPPWSGVSWIPIPFQSGPGQHYQTKAKLLYSASGIYGLFSCQDKTLTATMQADYMDLWKEDVIEVFFQPCLSKTAYFEYELSPLNYELPLAVYNENGKLNSWVPFALGDAPKTRRKVLVQGGIQQSMAEVSGWTAEFFLPFLLMKPVLEKIPGAGTKWKGNLYRIDYDHNAEETQWALFKNAGNFHEYEKFGDFYFE